MLFFDTSAGRQKATQAGSQSVQGRANIITAANQTSSIALRASPEPRSNGLAPDLVTSDSDPLTACTSSSVPVVQTLPILILNPAANNTAAQCRAKCTRLPAHSCRFNTSSSQASCCHKAAAASHHEVSNDNRAPTKNIGACRASTTNPPN